MKTIESIEVLYQLAITYNTVQAAFADMVLGFNSGPTSPLWDKLKNALDDHVVVIGVDGHTKVAKGKPDVLSYLSRQGATFRTNVVNAPVVGNNTAYIGGFAAWHDNDGDLDGDIQFVFGFVNRGTAGNPNWLAVRLFATRD
jgi:hypothetical protein